jgi:hypothetical protein
MSTLSQLVRGSLTALIAGSAALAYAQTATPQAATPQATPAEPAPAPAMGSGTKVDASLKVSAAFKRADANGDGKLSSAEAGKLPTLAAKFAELDKDKDGFLSSEEFSAGATVKSN